MAAARQEADWLLASIPTAWVINRNGWTKDPVQPLAIIPPQFRPRLEPPPPKTEAERAFESERAWGVLDRLFSSAPRRA